jgi:DNA-binding MarR family transcriptional regulator
MRRVTVRQRKAGGQIVRSKAEAIAELMLEVAQCFFRIRALGQKTGLITGWGGGAFGFMRSLALLGPLTVPQIAQMRPTSRQRMQRLADELEAERLVEFVDNPKHRRSKLVRLTRKGDARYRELKARFLAIASTMGAGLSEADVRRTTRIVRQLSGDATGHSAQLPFGSGRHRDRGAALRARASPQAGRQRRRASFSCTTASTVRSGARTGLGEYERPTTP